MRSRSARKSLRAFDRFAMEANFLLKLQDKDYNGRYDGGL